MQASEDRGETGTGGYDGSRNQGSAVEYADCRELPFAVMGNARKGLDSGESRGPPS